MSVKKNILKTGLASLIQKIIRTLEQLLLVPFFISAWGAAYYGEWLTLTIIPTIIGLSDLGFGTAAANSFILHFASGEKQKAANIYKSGFFTISVIISLGIILSFIVVFVLAYFRIFDKSLIDKQQAIIAVLLLMISRILGFYHQLFEAHFKAARRAALGMNIMTVYLAFNLLASLIVLLAKGGVIALAAINFSSTIIFIFAYAVIAKKILPLEKEVKGVILKKDIKEIANKGFGYLLSPIWQAVFFQGTTFIVRIVLGPIAVTVFNTVRTLTRAVNQANAIVISAVLPDLQFEIGAGNFIKARKIFRFGISVVFLIAAIGTVFLFIGGQWFYQIWTHKALSLPPVMWNLFLIGIVFSGLWWMSSEIFITANRPFDFVIASTIVAFVSLILSYYFAKLWGLTGAAIGSLFLDITLFVYIFPRGCKLIYQRMNRFVLELIEDYRTSIKNCVITNK